jgi:hypothetical protein
MMRVDRRANAVRAGVGMAIHTTRTKTVQKSRPAFNLKDCDKHSTVIAGLLYMTKVCFATQGWQLMLESKVGI